MERLRSLLTASKVPGAVACWGGPDGQQLLAHGVTRLGGPAVTADTRFDLASLTKVVAALPAILLLVSEGELELDRPLKHWFSNIGSGQTPSLSEATVRQLLAHNSGLRAYSRVHTITRDRLVALASTLQTPLDWEPGSGTAVYSDVGFMLLGALVERVTGQRLDEFVRERITGPLGMGASHYNPLDGEPEPADYAATEHCGWRNRLLIGEVHDENTVAWEGVSGHAGLFGTAADLAAYCRAWLTLDARLGSAELLREATHEQARTKEGERRGLGWVVGPAAFGGDLPGFGHTGYTGTSLWLDLDSARFAVLLTNRVHPNRHVLPGITELRAQFHRFVWDS